jgi:cation-transporting ATPase 13A3/4/5
LPESLPSDFDRVLDYNARMGRRIIGLATKNLQKMKLKDAKLLKRSDLENDLTFIGLLLFENKIKPVSRNVIK